MCICVYVYMRICILRDLKGWTRKRKVLGMYICVYVYMCICVYVYMCICILRDLKGVDEETEGAGMEAQAF